jgi:hypothetical protein
LRAAIAEGTDDLARRFFARIAKVVDVPWSTAVGNDLRMKETVGPRSAVVNGINWYMSKLHRVAHSDPKVAVAFHKVANLIEPPPTILHPKIALRVLRGSFRTKAPAKETLASPQVALPRP